MNKHDSIAERWWASRQAQRKVRGEYNGYSNYETWNVELWLDNDEALNGKKYDLIKKWGAKLPTTQVEAFIRWQFPNGTPDMSGARDLDKVNWEEIASGWREEATQM